VPVVRGKFAATINSLGGEGVGLGADANVDVRELDAPLSADLFGYLLSCGGEDRQGEGNHRGSELV
jgi:hypothetical protein